MAKIVVVGEGMVELCPNGPQDWRVRHGGDTLNTAIHLSRLGNEVAFLTALGTDPFSHELRLAWTGEGLAPDAILTDPARSPGLYAISLDGAGERRFTYWRSDSAARRLFALPGADAATAAAETADLLFFSLISLAVLPPDGRDALLRLAARVRARGGRVAFDTNYRPTLWGDRAEARALRDRALAVTDIGLPTLEDEEALVDAAGAAEIQALWHAAGVGEVVIKRGAEGCVAGGESLPPPMRLVPRDTSGAGDAFNAGYLHGRLNGLPPRAAALAGHRLAGWAVMQPGAIPPRTADAPYRELSGAA